MKSIFTTAIAMVFVGVFCMVCMRKVKKDEHIDTEGRYSFLVADTLYSGKKSGIIFGYHYYANGRVYHTEEKYNFGRPDIKWPGGRYLLRYYVKDPLEHTFYLEYRLRTREE